MKFGIGKLRFSMLHIGLPSIVMDTFHAFLPASRADLAEDSSKRKQRKKKYSEKGSRRFLRNVYTYGNWALLGHYAASSGNSSPTFRDNLSAPPSRFKGTDRIYRNMCKELPLLAA